MTTHTNTEIWTRWIDMWNGNLAVADEIIAPDFVAHFAPMGASPDQVRGPASLQQWIGGALSAFADVNFVTKVGPLVDGTLIAGHWVFTGAYRGGFPGSSPDVVGKRVEYAGMDFLRVEDGQIVEYWLCADMMSLLQQLGVMPS